MTSVSDDAATRTFALPGVGRATSSPWSGSPPSDLVGQVSRRLAVTALVAGGVDALYLALYWFVWPGISRWPAQVSSIAIVLGSVALAAWLWRRPRPAALVARAALVYEVATCLHISLAEHWGSATPQVPLDTVSWVCVVIVFYPLLVPAAPLRTLVGSLASASSYPLVLGLAVWLGGKPAPEADVLLSMLLPPYLCALIALVPSVVLHRLTADVARARRLGAYELVETLGQGGMGEVWRASHRLLARPAAVKLIRPEALSSRAHPDEIRARFEREAQATALLESPHTVEVYDFGVTDDGVLYLVMELLQGIDLETLVRRFGPVPPERAIDLLVQALDSLDDAHARGLVHRDVKPANVFLSRRGRRYDFVKVLDFGLVALARPDTADSRMTAEGSFVGTPSYCAPESFLGGPIDARTDLYAVGCLGYWLLTGATVFQERPGGLSVLAAHARLEPLPPSERTSGARIPAQLDDAILGCLEKDPERRPATARDLIRRLEACRTDGVWSDERARAWWREHLPDLGSARLD